SLSLDPPAPTAIHPLSLHDALPILGHPHLIAQGRADPAHLDRHPLATRESDPALGDSHIDGLDATDPAATDVDGSCVHDGGSGRSEEHTSELQSRVDLVCRLLLEKK